jgi:uncharacterized membrane protein YagU involved in acid resistance
VALQDSAYIHSKKNEFAYLMKNQSSNQGAPITSGLIPAILLTGLLAGTLDILAAFTHAFVANETTPIRVLQFIASKAVGPDAFSGGLPMAMLGLFFHYIIAFSWTTLFFLLYPRLKFLSGNKIMVGLGYGVFVWLMMNLVVLPIVNGAFQPFQLQSVIGMAILMLCIGLPISWMASKYYSGK